jgi:hypothetical protein
LEIDREWPILVGYTRIGPRCPVFCPAQRLLLEGPYLILDQTYPDADDGLSRRSNRPRDRRPTRPLWFVSVLRNRLGELEDQFFGTVLLASGRLFVATLFVSAAILDALIEPVDIGIISFGYARRKCELEAHSVPIGPFNGGHIITPA